ncbi:MAG: hypothetical protein J3K34DRAFT_386077 [Monoraphidium minutum]|nr:MAG: hypothetical protein J3K34DRAFT_386077 [Monoraphidium minutum]
MDDDFSFVGAPATGRGASGGAQGGRSAAAAGGGGTSASPARPRIAIPSAAQVAAAEQQRAPMPLLFRLSSAAAPDPSGAPPGGGGQHAAGAAAAAGAPPFHAQPPAAGPPAYQAPGPSSALNFSISLPRHVDGAPPGHPRAPQQQWLAPPQQWPPPQQQQQQQQQQPAAASAAAAAAAAGAAGAALLVSPRQQGNPLLKHVRMVRWQYKDITADYQMGQDAAAVFLSLRYHLLHPGYVLPRLKAASRSFRLLVLLVHVDGEDAAKPLRELARLAVGLDATLVCAFSNEECARYLELFKAYEQKPASAIQGRTDTDYVGRLTSALTSVRGVNRNDAYTIGSTFGTLADAFRAPAAAFARCPGLGPVKARRLHDAFSQPFRRPLGGGGGGGSGGGGGLSAAAAGPSGSGGGGGGSGAGEEEALGDCLDESGPSPARHDAEGPPAGPHAAVEFPISDDEEPRSDEEG